MTTLAHRRPSRFSPLVLGLLLAGCTTPVSAHASTEDEIPFDRHEVVIGSGERQTVLTGFLSGGPRADLVVVDIDGAGERRVRVYAFDGRTWALRLAAALPRDVLFVDVVRLAGRDRLVTYAPGRLEWFEHGSAAAQPLVATDASFTPPRRGEIPHVDVTRDVNGDGLDDLVVPGFGGFEVHVQRSDGTFAEPVRVGPVPDLSGITGADGYRYDPWSRSRIHAVDVDGDGRSDLVSWAGGRFEVHRQDEQGVFAREPTTFTTDVPFDSDDVLSLAEGDMTGRVLHSLADLDGDGVAELVIASLEGERLSQKRSTYEVHSGTRSRGGLTFSRRADATFRTEGRIQLGMDRTDLDGDGQVDLVFTSIEREATQGSLWKDFKGFMGDDIGLWLEFYRGEAGRFPDAPSATRGAAFDGVPSHREPGSVPLDLVLRGATHERRRTDRVWPKAFDAPLLLGDITGDGRADLIVGGHPRKLAVFTGVPSPDVFSPRSREIRVDPPNDAEDLWLVDLDQDGGLDILMHRRFLDRDLHGGPERRPGTEAQRVVLLLAK